MSGLSYYHDSSEVLLCNFRAILVISGVLGKCYRQIKGCCGMTSCGVCDESIVLRFSWCVYVLLHIIILPCVGKMLITASPETKLLNLRMSKKP